MKRNKPAAQRPSTSGFTLIEILVVVMIITLLASIVAVNVLRKPGEARISTAKMQIRQLQTALQLYRSEQGLLPSQEQGLEALVAQPTTDPIPQRYPAEGYLESRRVPNVYFCGEVLDIDGDCGGFNLQWAWASGRLAGRLR